MTNVSTIHYKLPGLNDLNQEICKIIKNNLQDILVKVALEYELDEEELKEKYLTDIAIDSTESSTDSDRKSVNKRTRKAIPPESRCMAKVASGNQCRRSKKGEYSDYCGGHATSRPYGRIDHLKKSKKSTWENRPTEIDLEDLDMDESTVVEIKDKKYVLYNYQLYEIPEDHDDDEIELDDLNICADIDEDGNITWLN
jgi:hypothetical protein